MLLFKNDELLRISEFTEKCLKYLLIRLKSDLEQSYYLMIIIDQMTEFGLSRSVKIYLFAKYYEHVYPYISVVCL